MTCLYPEAIPVIESDNIDHRLLSVYINVNILPLSYNLAFNIQIQRYKFHVTISTFNF